ncbi:hypothetical protein SmJEL517_g05612 [Synchytrium microbalum]|uniref:FYR N-terminal domain-containing protein n=1 Tax=Synchytrium microbalum TaxID=1806994 RepID=A0A507C064_9FUNG|nr:uncharacterized protein SmJEL517_g05612 [Synchytrium microbalum]TPX30923.1 hypothetical protein SmJEL517_g05612 [Synchytrium microbalum]
MDYNAALPPLSAFSPSEEKYKLLKKRMKELLQANDDLTERLQRSKAKISLLDRLSVYEPVTASEQESQSDESSQGSDQDMEDEELAIPVQKPRSARQKPAPEPYSQPALVPQNTLTEGPVSDAAAIPPTTRKRKTTSSKGAAPKRTPAAKKPRAPAQSRSRKIQVVNFDDQGHVILPIQAGVVTVHALGTIVFDRDNFHNERYIFPVGFTSSRGYASMVDPEKQTVYTSSVVDGGDGPRFQVVAEDAPDRQFVAVSPTGVWTAVMKAVNAARQKEHTNSVSGPDYFGFTQSTIAKLIQEMPNANLCKNYIQQDFTQPASKQTRPRRGKGRKKEDDESAASITVDDLKESVISTGRSTPINEMDTDEFEETTKSTPARIIKPVAVHADNHTWVMPQPYTTPQIAQSPRPLSPPNHNGRMTQSPYPSSYPPPPQQPQNVYQEQRMSVPPTNQPHQLQQQQHMPPVAHPPHTPITSTPTSAPHSTQPSPNPSSHPPQLQQQYGGEVQSNNNNNNIQQQQQQQHSIHPNMQQQLHQQLHQQHIQQQPQHFMALPPITSISSQSPSPMGIEWQNNSGPRYYHAGDRAGSHSREVSREVELTNSPKPSPMAPADYNWEWPANLEAMNRPGSAGGLPPIQRPAPSMGQPPRSLQPSPPPPQVFQYPTNYKGPIMQQQQPQPFPPTYLSQHMSPMQQQPPQFYQQQPPGNYAQYNSYESYGRNRHPSGSDQSENEQSGDPQQQQQ